MKPDKKGKPAKKNDGWTKSWAKLFLVMACILFVGVMIITSLGTNWLVTMKPAETGDTVVIDLTLRDATGRPVLTTNERIFNASFQKGEIVWLTRPLTLAVNATTTEVITAVPAYRYDYGEASFGLLGDELNKISDSLEGMKQGETQKIVFPYSDQFQRDMDPEQFAQMGGNFSMAMQGDQLLLAFTTTPEINIDANSTPEYAVRTSLITGKNSENVTVSYGYPTADITIIRLNSG
jgi:hypothetical protein